MKLLALTLITTLSSFLISSENLSKKWVLTQMEEFGDQWTPGEENKNDFVDLKEDGTYTMIIYGAEKAGTYVHKGATLNFTNGEEKFFWKILSSSATELVVEYQQPSLIRTNLYFKPAE